MNLYQLNSLMIGAGQRKRVNLSSHEVPKSSLDTMRTSVNVFDLHFMQWHTIVKAYVVKGRVYWCPFESGICGSFSGHSSWISPANMPPYAGI